MTLDEFIKAEGLTVRIAVLNIIPQDQLDGTDDQRKWATEATWYESTVIRGSGWSGEEVTIQIGCGPDAGELTAAEVLNALAGISRDIGNSPGFEDWCEEAGRDSDSRAAESDYEDCKIIASRTELVCGSRAAYETLMHDTEQL